MGISRDITDRKKAEEEQARLTTILEATPDPVGITNLNGEMLYLNRAGRRMMRIGEDEPLTTPGMCTSTSQNGSGFVSAKFSQRH